MVLKNHGNFVFVKFTLCPFYYIVWKSLNNISNFNSTTNHPVVVSGVNCWLLVPCGSIWLTAVNRTGYIMTWYISCSILGLQIQKIKTSLVWRNQKLIFKITGNLIKSKMIQNDFVSFGSDARIFKQSKWSWSKFISSQKMFWSKILIIRSKNWEPLIDW